MALLLDVTDLCAHHTDAAIEHIYKAASEPPGEDIWAEHPSPFVRRLIELFTERGLTRTAAMRDELQKWLGGGMHREAERPARPDGAMARWSRAELALVKLYLETLPAAAFTLDDWLMVIDYLVQRYLPADDLRGEADWLSTRAALMGSVQAAMGEATPEQADKLLRAMPSSAAEAETKLGLDPVQRAVIEYGNARCAENVVAISDLARHRLRRFIVDYLEAEFLGNRAETAESLQTRLVDEFGTLNRDWRRIAVTEAGENMNQGLVASVEAGTKLKRVEKYRGACAFCRSIDDKVVTVVSPDATNKDGDTQVWPGKTNVGRSAAPRKRVGNELVDREPHERWWIAAGVQHPHCRGGWIKLEQGTAPVDPKFSEWMDQVLRRG
jgi:hypothetical protein